MGRKWPDHEFARSSVMSLYGLLTAARTFVRIHSIADLSRTNGASSRNIGWHFRNATKPPTAPVGFAARPVWGDDRLRSGPACATRYGPRQGRLFGRWGPVRSADNGTRRLLHLSFPRTGSVRRGFRRRPDYGRCATPAGRRPAHHLSTLDRSPLRPARSSFRLT